MQNSFAAISNKINTSIFYAGGSSYRADNVAYTKNGKFAFIDIEYSSHKTPSYDLILLYPSNEMAVYWKKLAGIK